MVRQRSYRAGRESNGYPVRTLLASAWKLLGAGEEDDPGPVSERQRLTGSAPIEDISSPRESLDHGRPIGDDESDDEGRRWNRGRVNGYGAVGGGAGGNTPRVEPSPWSDSR